LNQFPFGLEYELRIGTRGREICQGFLQNVLGLLVGVLCEQDHLCSVSPAKVVQRQIDPDPRQPALHRCYFIPAVSIFPGSSERLLQQIVGGLFILNDPPDVVSDEPREPIV
jgi:hypothetical protein